MGPGPRDLKDANKPFTQRYAVLRSLRFFHGWKPQETNREVTRGLGMAVEQGDVADLAVEDLRRSENWDLTAAVLAQFSKKSHGAPIVQRSIVRYALNCPKPEAKTFIDAVRTQDAGMVKDGEEKLQFEKKEEAGGQRSVVGGSEAMRVTSASLAAITKGCAGRALTTGAIPQCYASRLQALPSLYPALQFAFHP